MHKRDTNADGVLDERVYVLQNWRADVTGSSLDGCLDRPDGSCASHGSLGLAHNTKMVGL